MVNQHSNSITKPKLELHPYLALQQDIYSENAFIKLHLVNLSSLIGTKIWLLPSRVIFGQFWPLTNTATVNFIPQPP